MNIVTHTESFKIVFMQAQTSKSIMDLLLLNLRWLNGHAPPTTESRKSYQSVNPFCFQAG